MASLNFYASLLHVMVVFDKLLFWSKQNWNWLSQPSFYRIFKVFIVFSGNFRLTTCVSTHIIQEKKLIFAALIILKFYFKLNAEILNTNVVFTETTKIMKETKKRRSYHWLVQIFIEQNWWMKRNQRKVLTWNNLRGKTWREK